MERLKPWLLWLVIVVIALVLLRGIWVYGHCHYLGWQLERDTRYGAFAGCLVRSGDGWLPIERLRSVE